LVRNLEAELPGRTRGTEVVVVGAHYDTVPGSPGANDNGTGVAAMLELARVLQSDGLDRTLRLVAFVNEEPPYFKTREMGSLVYARACRRRRDRVTAMLSLETIGYYSERPRTQVYPPLLSVFYPDRGNFIGFVGNWRSRRLVRRTVACFRRHTAVPVQSAALPALLPGIAWSDHWSFWRSGYKALMVTDTAPFRYPHYHTARDTPNQIDYDRTTEVVAALEHVVRDLTNGE
jgi:Zn-dependent M28 family amino/carboxypeptidase